VGLAPNFAPFSAQLRCGVKKLDRGGEPDRLEGLVAGLAG